MSAETWDECKKAIEESIHELKAAAKELSESVTDLRIEIATLKVKAGLWGAIGAALPVIGGVLFIFLKG